MHTVKRLEHARILMYSHDTFGLGHLTRCRAIAHALVERFKGLSVLIVTGSPIAGSFSFRARVDFVKIPSVIKLYNGQYTSTGELIDLNDTLEIREAIIRHTAASFKPDILIVDKEPMGLKGEMEQTLRMLKEQGTTLVLGLRDVMDSPERLRAEWKPNDVLGKVAALYDHIWVYGPRDFWHPLNNLDAPEALGERTVFTGYLRRRVPEQIYPPAQPFTNPYVLVTVGGGADGERLMDWIIKTYQQNRDLPYPALLVLGPFMAPHVRENIRQRARALHDVKVLDYENNLEHLMTAAIGVVAMGGYNTFCEIYSFDKRALVHPRTHPRQEQLIRARRAEELGLVGMLDPGQWGDPALMARALKDLPNRPLPSDTAQGDLLAGLNTIGGLVEDIVTRRNRPALSLVETSRSS